MNGSKFVAIVALVSAAGVACAQDAFVSGYLHTSVGGATIGPVEGRRLPVHNLGSSGNDGVEVKLRTAHIGVVHADLTSMTSPSSTGTTGECRTKYKGWDGTIKGRMSVSGAFSSGHVLEQCDFSTLGPPGSVEVEVTCRTSAGDLVVLPRVHAPQVSWTTFATYGPGEQVSYGLSGGKVSFSDLSFMCKRTTNRPARLEFLNNGALQVIPDVIEVMCRPICIVAPCPGDWTNLDSIIVTGTGMTDFAVYDAALGREGVNPFYESKSVLRIHSAGGAHLTEQCCADLDGDGVPDDVVIGTNIGSSGQDGVSIDFPPNTAGASRRWGNGHVTLMKFTDEEGSEMRVTSVKDPLACTSTFTPDFTALGATGCVCVCRDQFDNVLSTRDLSIGQSFTFLNACATPLNSSMECRKAGGGQMEFVKVLYSQPHQVSFGGGIVVAGVKSVEMSPVQPRDRFGNLANCTTTSSDGTLYVGDSTLFPAPPECPADFNGDGAVDFFDYLDFVDAFSIGC